MLEPTEVEMTALRKVNQFKLKVDAEVERLMLLDPTTSLMTAQIAAEEKLKDLKPTAVELGLSIDAQVYSMKVHDMASGAHQLDRLKEVR